MGRARWALGLQGSSKSLRAHVGSTKCKAGVPSPAAKEEAAKPSCVSLLAYSWALMPPSEARGCCGFCLWYPRHLPGLTVIGLLVCQLRQSAYSAKLNFQE